MSEVTRQEICDELAAARTTFHQLTSAMTAEDLTRRTNGTRWTNREMLFHMLFGYVLVRTLVPMVKAFDRLPHPVSRCFAAVLNAGTRPFHPINFPTRWDPFFTPCMTVREVYHYPTQHFEFHRHQLTLNARPTD